MRWKRWACAMINDVRRASHVDIEVHELNLTLDDLTFENVTNYLWNYCTFGRISAMIR
jgi:hypothetical protein